MIIGLLGQAGVGKDTIADHFVSSHRFIKIALADPMKRICQELFDFTDDQLWGPSESRNAPDFRYPTGTGYLSPRVALQTLGTEWGRKAYDATWIRYALRVSDAVMSGEYEYSQKHGLKKMGKVIKALTRKPKGVVIPDIRFLNEMNHVHSEDRGFVIRVRRPEAEKRLVGIPNHLSELEQKFIADTEFDAVLNNYGPKWAVYDEATLVLKRLISHKKLKVILGGT